MDDLFYFYSTSAEISFVLLGFWWAIVTFKHDEWMANPLLRRMSRYISFHFLIPGTMSLMAILATNHGVVWRTAFGVGGVLGALAACLSYQASTRSARRGTGRDPAWLALVAAYAAITVVAVGGPALTAALGLGEKALVVEGMLVGLLLLLGANFAWTLFSQERRPPG